MAEKRKDSKGRILRDGEAQRKDGRYRYQYVDGKGKRHEVYSWKLVATDRTPVGKKDDISLREKEKQIRRDLEDGIMISAGNKTTLNDMFDLYMSGKSELKQSSKASYLYTYKKYVSEAMGTKKITDIKFSHIKRFYCDLLKDKGFKPNSLNGEIIGLRWQDCDFENRVININHNLVYRKQDNGKYEMHVSTPKTNAGCRTIPMLDAVRKALLEEKNNRCKRALPRRK